MYRKKLNSKQPWRCGSCVCRRQNKKCEPEGVEDSGAMTSFSSIKNELLSEIKKLLAPINDTITELKKDMAEMRNFTEHVSDNYDSFLVELKNIKSDMAIMKENCDRLSGQLSEKDKEITVLTTQLSQLEQYVRNKNLLINGIPEVQGEDCKNIVTRVAEELGIKLDPTEIDVAHRLKGSKNAPPGYACIKEKVSCNEVFPTRIEDW